MMPFVSHEEDFQLQARALLDERISSIATAVSVDPGCVLTALFFDLSSMGAPSASTMAHCEQAAGLVGGCVVAAGCADKRALLREERDSDDGAEVMATMCGAEGLALVLCSDTPSGKGRPGKGAKRPLPVRGGRRRRLVCTSGGGRRGPRWPRVAGCASGRPHAVLGPGSC